MWKKAAAAAESVEESSATVGVEEASSSRNGQSWAMLIKRVYEVDPLSCPASGSQMEVVTFIEPPQEDVMERILCGHQSGADQGRPKLRLCARSVPVGRLWRSSAARAPPADGKGNGVDAAARPDTEPHELTYVDMATFLTNF